MGHRCSQVHPSVVQCQAHFLGSYHALHPGVVPAHGDPAKEPLAALHHRKNAEAQRDKETPPGSHRQGMADLGTDQQAHRQALACGVAWVGIFKVPS